MPSNIAFETAQSMMFMVKAGEYYRAAQVSHAKKNLIPDWQ